MACGQEPSTRASGKRATASMAGERTCARRARRNSQAAGPTRSRPWPPPWFRNPTRKTPAADRWRAPGPPPGSHCTPPRPGRPRPAHRPAISSCPAGFTMSRRWRCARLAAPAPRPRRPRTDRSRTPDQPGPMITRKAGGRPARRPKRAMACSCVPHTCISVTGARPSDCTRRASAAVNSRARPDRET